MTFEERDVCKIVWYGIMGILKINLMSYKQKEKIKYTILPHQIKGIERNKPQRYKLNQTFSI
jgi:hypothetical protein